MNEYNRVPTSKNNFKAKNTWKLVYKLIINLYYNLGRGKFLQ